MRRMHLGCVPDHHLLALHLWSTDGLNAKDFPLLRFLVAACAPSRLLVFGLSPQLLALNSGQGAATAFVEDADSARGVLVGRGPSSSAAVHVSRYPDPAGEAWALLRRARSRPASTCRRRRPARASCSSRPPPRTPPPSGLVITRFLLLSSYLHALFLVSASTYLAI